MKTMITRISALSMLLILILTSSLFARNGEDTIADSQTGRNIYSHKSNSSTNYDGQIRIFMVEPASRYKEYNNQPYHYGFLNFAYDTSISLANQETLNRTISFNYTGITGNNIMAIAVVYNGEAHQGYSDQIPPIGYPFDAYYIDACAAGDASNSWPNDATGGFTHTVFIEEATAQWCYNCPLTSNALEHIYLNNGYSFFYASMVTDLNSVAEFRMLNDYNLWGMPTCYFDGGLEVFAGGIDTLSFYETRIEACGAREVPSLDLSVDLTWMGSNTVQLDLSLTNNQSPTAVGSENHTSLPVDFKLEQNYPNPFNPVTTIDYSLSRKSNVNISVFNIMGQRVKTLVDQSQAAGNYKIEWNGQSDNGGRVATGIYFYLMKTDDFSETRKMILLK